jgi:hypothetical protein
MFIFGKALPLEHIHDFVHRDFVEGLKIGISFQASDYKYIYHNFISYDMDSQNLPTLLCSSAVSMHGSQGLDKVDGAHPILKNNTFNEVMQRFLDLLPGRLD